jgi:hypothetical protein
MAGSAVCIAPNYPVDRSGDPHPDRVRSTVGRSGRIDRPISFSVPLRRLTLRQEPSQFWPWVRQPLEDPRRDPHGSFTHLGLSPTGGAVMERTNHGRCIPCKLQHSLCQREGQDLQHVIGMAIGSLVSGGQEHDPARQARPATPER